MRPLNSLGLSLLPAPEKARVSSWGMGLLQENSPDLFDLWVVTSSADVILSKKVSPVTLNP